MPGAQLTNQQVATKDYLVFADFDTMDTHVAREAMTPNRLAWCENLQIIGPNQLTTVAAPAGATATLGGRSVVKLFYAFGGGVDFEIAFCSDGSMQAINLASGGVTQIAPAGTFSNPDVSVWEATTLVIADPTAGYCSWNGQTLSKPGGVSNNIVVTNGGSGYFGGATVAITGGTGAGATATATVIGNVVSSITLTNAGNGYSANDTLTVTITGVTGGSGATATVKVWPQFALSTPTTVAVYAGRVWIAGGRTLTWTGTGGLDDAALADASGSTILPDADLVHRITALRSLNNFLWIFGDNSIKQIGTVSVNGSTTVFSIVTLSSDTGTIFPQTIQSYNRLVLFANTVGTFAVLGSSVQKISEEMDGIFQNIDFTTQLSAGVADLANIRCYLLLVRYMDPVQNRTRSLLLVFQAKKWFVCAQGDGLVAVSTAVINAGVSLFGSSGSDITKLFGNKSNPVSILLQTALAHHSKPHMGKRAIRAATAQTSSGAVSINMTIDTENGSVTENYTVSFPIVWQNALNQVVNFINALSQLVTFSGSGFLFQRTPAAGTGIYLGLTLRGTLSGYSFNNGIIEYQEATALASKTAA